MLIPAYGDIARSRMDFRFRGKSGRAADITAMTEVDPSLPSVANFPAMHNAAIPTRCGRAWSWDWGEHKRHPEFISLIAGTAIAVPRAACRQQGDRLS